MGRHNEELEAERTYELIKREKENSGTWLKSFLTFLFSQVGLVILSAAIAVVGEPKIYRWFLCHCRETTVV